MFYLFVACSTFLFLRPVYTENSLHGKVHKFLKKTAKYKKWFQSAQKSFGEYLSHVQKCSFNGNHCTYISFAHLWAKKNSLFPRFFGSRGASDLPPSMLGKKQPKKGQLENKQKHDSEYNPQKTSL